MNLLDYIEFQKSKAPSLAERFHEYDRENPHIYQLFIKYARMVKDTGFNKFSAKAIFERLRWHVMFETHDIEPFKLNNSYTAFYARKAIKDYPEFDGFFETRKKKG